MTTIPIPLSLESSPSRAKALSSQRLINVYAEPGTGKSPFVLHGSHGNTTFGTAATGPSRGMHVMKRVPYILAGNVLNSLDEAGAVTTHGSGILGNDFVTMADNGKSMVIVSEGNGYVFDWENDTLTEITDPDFGPAASVTFLNRKFVYVRSNTGQLFINEVTGPANFDGTEFATAQRNPDDLIFAIANRGELYLFGEKTLEFWFDNGNADFPFAPIPGASINRGLGAKNSVVRLNNTVYWYGDDGVIYRVVGRQAERVSTHAIEFQIKSYATQDDAEAFGFKDEGHEFYVISFPTGSTWVLDSTTGKWHDRKSNDVDRWRMRGYARAYGKHLTGDMVDGTVYQLSLDSYVDTTAAMIRSFTSEPIHSEGKSFSVSRVELEITVGEAQTTGQGSDPKIMLRTSLDGGNTWSNRQSGLLGKIGDYGRIVVWGSLGQVQDSIIFEWSVSDPVPLSVFGARAEVSIQRPSG